MTTWLDIRKAIPGVQGFHLHTVKTEPGVLTTILLNLGFKIYVIDGAKIRDESSFFSEVAKVFDFPAYFGHNWDAWNECLGDFRQSLTANRTAIIWEHADQAFDTDAQTFLEAVCDLNRLSISVAHPPLPYSTKDVEPRQMEIFLLGQGNGFKPLN
jgi:RNAse (barnase) inhibitor barstar